MLHEYVADQPHVVALAVALPLAGSAGGVPQSTRVQVGCKPLQLPSAWQVRVLAVVEKE